MRHKIFLFVILLVSVAAGSLYVPAMAGQQKATLLTEKGEKTSNVLRIGMYAADKGVLDPHFAASDIRPCSCGHGIQRAGPLRAR